MKQKLLLLGAVLFGVLAFMFTFSQINKEKARLQGETYKIYLIQVARDIPEGEKITEDMIQKKLVQRFRNARYEREIPYDRRSLVIGREAQSLIRAGTLLQWSDLKVSLTSGKTGLTSLIRPGYRAISISVDATSSVTGLVQPNNYVDLIGTFRFPDTRGDSSAGPRDRNRNRYGVSCFLLLRAELCGAELQHRDAGTDAERGRDDYFRFAERTPDHEPAQL